jgi:hypothetical protein
MKPTLYKRLKKINEILDCLFDFSRNISISDGLENLNKAIALLETYPVPYTDYEQNTMESVQAILKLAINASDTPIRQKGIVVIAENLLHALLEDKKRYM